MKKNIFKKISAVVATAVMAVSCGTITSFASEAGASASLSSASGLAGGLVSVDLVLNTDDMCCGYNFGIEFDEALTLESVDGTFANEIGNGYATVINLTGMYFKDDKAVTTLTFRVPEDAEEGEEYDVKFADINSFDFDGGQFVNPKFNNATVKVLESAKKVTNNLVYVTQEDGLTVTRVAPRGDANGDGIADVRDAVAIATNLISTTGKFNNEKSFFADVNQDGVADVLDAIALAHYILASDKNSAWGSIIK